ncbi:MAG: hypothetical protein LBB36_02255, partial [Fibromonadaceae bacterium]|nr:hypothetical protein [Fibromonadaceae bacterium]
MPRTAVKKKKPKIRTRTMGIPVEAAAEGSGNGKYIVLAVFLSVFLLASLLSLVGNVFAEPGVGRNLFGPHAAKFSEIEFCLFGPFPLILLLLAALSFITWLYLKKIQNPPVASVISFGHYTLGFMLLYVFFSIIFAVIMPDTLKNVPLKFEMASREYAGFIGLFMAKRVFPPIFGQDTGGLLFCSYIGILMTAFCFGLRPKHLFEAAKKIKLSIRILLYNMDFAREKPKVTMYARQPDTGDYIAVRLGEVKPAKGSPFGKQEKQDLTITKDPFKSEPISHISPDEDQPKDAIDQINRQLALTTDPREIRRLRDELAEYKRIKDINEWEDVKGG